MEHGSGINGRVQFRVLGPLAVVADDGTPVRLGSARERFVLAMLLVAADRLVPADRLIDALWEEPPPTAKQQLQNLIAGLRRRLAAHDSGLVVTRPFGYELRLATHTLDLATFRHAVAEARALEAQGNPHEVVRLLDAAVGLWRGQALSDVAPAADASIEALQQSLRDERLAAVDLLVGALAELGRHEEALVRAVAQLEEDPWNERLHEHRLRALAATGRRSEASEAYRRLRRRFLDELGVPPGRALADLNSQILNGGPVGHHAPSSRRVVPRELPAPTWTLVGREALLGAILTRLAPRLPDDDRSSSRSAVARASRAATPPALVVLVGAGGGGKTALAVTAGHSLADAYPDGTLYAALGDDPSGAADPHHVAARFLRALGVEGSSVPADRADRIALYRSTVAGKRILTVIDGATSESQVRPLLPTSPGAGAIVTSRSKLAGLVGVRRHTVGPLTADASRALVAELAGPDRELDDEAALEEVTALCGHLPLALCVAGAKLATNAALDVATLKDRLAREHARLDELSAGDIDVRASISLSVQDLAPPTRALLRRLATAPADWPAWVARLLLRGVAREIETQHALDELIDRHLVEPTGRDGAGQPRYRAHSLVSELADEHLVAEEGPAARTVHSRSINAAWLDLATIADSARSEVADPGSPGRIQGGDRVQGGDHVRGGDLPDGGAAAEATPDEWFEAERHNLVGAAVLAASQQDWQQAAGIALCVRGFFTVRAYDDDRERTLRAALAAPAGTYAARQHLELLGALFAVLAQRRVDDELPRLAASALAIAREAEDVDLEHRALSLAAWAATALHRYDEALHWLERARDLADQAGDAAGRVRAEAQRGVILRNTGRAAEADPLLAAMVAESRTWASRRSTSIWLATRAEGLIDLGRWDEAQELVTEAVTIAAELKDELGEAHCRLALARIHLGLGRLRLVTEQLALAKPELDARAGAGGDLDVLRLEVDLLASQGSWSRAAELARRLVSGRRASGQRLELAADLARLARIQRATSQDAAELDTEVRSILEGLSLTPDALRLQPLAYATP